MVVDVVIFRCPGSIRFSPLGAPGAVASKAPTAVANPMTAVSLRARFNGESTLALFIEVISPEQTLVARASLKRISNGRRKTCLTIMDH
jgi:hypothetical protein